MIKFGKRGFALLASGVVTAIVAVGGYAYFTSTGNGSGSATVGTSTAWQVDTFAAVGGPLTPGGLAGTYQTVDYTVKNNGSGQQNLTNVTVKVATAAGAVWSAQADTLKPACTKDDFQLSANGGTTWAAIGAPVIDAALAGNKAAGSTTAHATITIRMIDTGANQDNCKTLTVPLYLTAA